MIKSKRVNVTDVAVSVMSDTDTARLSERKIVIRNLGAATVFLGGSDVTAAQGWTLSANEEITLELKGRDELFAICTAALTASVQVIQAGV